MTLLIILLIGVFSGLLAGAILRRVGAIRRIADMVLGLVGAFVGGAMGSSALITGLTKPDMAMAAGAAAGLVLAAHLGSALIRPVHAKYYRR